MSQNEYKTTMPYGGAAPSVVLMGRDLTGELQPIACDISGNICTGAPVAGLPVGYFLTNIGDGTGTSNLIGDYSAVATDFFYTATTRYDAHTVLVTISDNANFNQTDYGAIVGGLTNGVKLFIHPVGAPAPIQLLSGYTFKKNYEWLAITSHTSLTSFAGLSQTLVIEFELVNDYGKPLNLAIGDKFIVRLNDNLTSLVSHTFAVRGIKY